MVEFLTNMEQFQDLHCMSPVLCGLHPALLTSAYNELSREIFNAFGFPNQSSQLLIRCLFNILGPAFDEHNNDNHGEFTNPSYTVMRIYKENPIVFRSQTLFILLGVCPSTSF